MEWELGNAVFFMVASQLWGSQIPALCGEGPAPVSELVLKKLEKQNCSDFKIIWNITILHPAVVSLWSGAFQGGKWNAELIPAFLCNLPAFFPLLIQSAVVKTPQWSNVYFGFVLSF